jgi:hypothetical protein
LSRFTWRWYVSFALAACLLTVESNDDLFMVFSPSELAILTPGCKMHVLLMHVVLVGMCLGYRVGVIYRFDRRIWIGDANVVIWAFCVQVYYRMSVNITRNSGYVQLYLFINLPSWLKECSRSNLICEFVTTSSPKHSIIFWQSTQTPKSET